VTEATTEGRVTDPSPHPEAPLRRDQIPCLSGADPNRFAVFSSVRGRRPAKMHSLEEYGLNAVKLYEDITSMCDCPALSYPVKVEGRYVMDPSADPKSTTQS